MNENTMESIAVIGMSCRFPMADTLDEFWDNLIKGKECISHHTEEELLEIGIDPTLLKNPNYKRARGEIDGMDQFDASFFGFTPKEACLMDPQHRIALECAWHALEDSGYDSERYDGRIGVFAGESMNSYLILNVLPVFADKYASSISLQAAIGNDKDSLTTTIAYKMDLTGAAVTVQTSSSTSLSAIDIACQSILSYQCDMAISGGVSIGVPKKSGYLYEEGGIVSADGHCRPFDHRSSGFVPGNGCGMVVLKRLSEAVRDKDNIYSIIKGFAINNDGSKKVSYSAPSVTAQSEVILEAQSMSDIPVETIRYVEAHGTGTRMGDPIEIAALTKAFSCQTNKKNFCAIGSVKGNIGHLDTAAGVAGLIKTSMILKNRHIPPSINFEKPNSQIQFSDSPFYVNTENREWIDHTTARAAVTSLGMGGTNVHIVMEEPPALEELEIISTCRTFVISAKSETALSTHIKNFAEHLTLKSDLSIDDITFTMQCGRKEMAVRYAAAYHSTKELAEHLQTVNESMFTDISEIANKQNIVFMFSGQGTQYQEMASEFYKNNAIFRKHIDHCKQLISNMDGTFDLQAALPPYERVLADIDIQSTKISQPAIFSIEYALAKTLIHYGVIPDLLVGHSIGEYVAMCISGVVTLETSLKMILSRAHRMMEMPVGGMLSASLSKDEAKKYLEERSLSIAAINANKSVVFSGKTEEINKLENLLIKENIRCTKLKTSHAFHSEMMHPGADKYYEDIQNITYGNMEIPIISSVFGRTIQSEELTGYYFKDQIIKPVDFHKATTYISQNYNPLFVEIGMGSTLCSLILQNKKADRKSVIQTLPGAKEKHKELLLFDRALGALWQFGVPVKWDIVHEENNKHRISLPLYPFQRNQYWVSQDGYNENQSEQANEVGKTQEIHRTFTLQEIVDITKTKWVEILYIAEISNNEDFFEVGGDSLAVIQLTTNLNTVFKDVVTSADLFINTTINQQAELINSKINVTSADETKDSIDNLIHDVNSVHMDIDKVIDRLNSLEDEG